MTTTIEWPAKRVRETYIKYFCEKQAHTFVESSPVVPHDDPTLLFANAGMNQFKPIFLGSVDPSSPLAKMTRAANSQKCIRAGGKHNDLEDVGKDVYHHTFFEMLGNWSFGDYFKEESISWAWELLTQVFGLPKDRLYATYFGGDVGQGVPADDEAKNLWLRFLPATHVLPFGMKENFWEMGDTGPCGPCTEIHFDRIGGRDAGHLVNMDDPDVLEIWNLVFIQFNRESATSLKKLPACHVDTGMGFERLTSVLQNKRSNYDTDVFQYIFDYIQGKFGAPKYQGRVGAADVDHVDMAYRVVADHIRTLTVAITDGAVPDNAGRGYVLRRIVRRAARFGRQFLNTNTGFLSDMVPIVCEHVGEFFPELRRKQKDVQAVILEEEQQFGKTLDRGLKRFLKVIEGINGKIIPGAEAFKLFDTFGFPLDLTQLMAEERGLEVDVAGYNKHMSEARLRDSASASKQSLKLEVDQLDGLQRMGCVATQDNSKYLWSVGQAVGPALPARVLAVWSGSSFLKSCSVGDQSVIGLVLDKTSFYAESGGQVADQGRICAGAGFGDGQNPDGGEPWKYWELDVTNVQKFGSYVLHIGSLRSGTVSAGDEAVCNVDYALRAPVASNHTATHVLNFALRKHLDQEEVMQKGSLVDADKLRFDFNHNGPVPLEKLAAVEKEVEGIIKSNLRIYSQDVPQQAALQIHGLRAVFGETYPDNVRVVSIGRSVKDLLATPSNKEWVNYSVEFCGGTHVDSTAFFENFVILQEEGISKGVRRVTATTRSTARAASKNASTLQARVNALGVINDSQTLSDEVAKLRSEIDNEEALLPLIQRRKMEDQLGELKKKSVAVAKQAKSSGEFQVVAEKLAADAVSSKAKFAVGEVPTGANPKTLKSALDEFESKAPNVAVLLFGVDSAKNKFAALASVPASLTGKLDASQWVSATVVDVCGGKGGGKQERAQGSGDDASKVNAAIEAGKKFATGKLA